MTILPTSLDASLVRIGKEQSARLSAALGSKEISPPSGAAPGVRDVAVKTDLPEPRSQLLNLRSDVLDLASVSNTFEALDIGGLQVSRLLGQMMSLAMRATLDLTDSELAAISGQFQALRISINSVPPQPPGSQYSVAETVAALPPQVRDQVVQVLDGGDVTLGGFNDVKLLGDPQTNNLLTPQAAQQMVATLERAMGEIAAQQEVVRVVRAVLEFNAAIAQTALGNQQALEAVFEGSEIALPDPAQSIALNPALAKAAQTNRLPPNVLQLLA